MKRLIILLVMLLSSHLGSAQKFKEWFRQKKTQKQYLIEQIALFKSYSELTEKGYKIAKQGLTTIGNIKNGEFKMHKNKFDSLRIVKPDLAKHSLNYATAYQIVWTVELYYQVEDILKENQWLTDQERRHYKSVIDQAVWDGVDILDNLADVTKSGKLTMTDNARIERINELYGQSQVIYVLVRQIYTEAAMLGWQRRSEKENITNSRILHGLN